MNKVWSCIRFLASLKLAVFIILALTVISIVGTVVEARYDAVAAQKWVYHSIYMVVILGALCVNLVAVMVDRWPWKRHHSGFVLAHVGILFLILGAWLTQQFGVDGSMAIAEGESNRYVTLGETDLLVYGSYGNGQFPLLFRKEVDFFLNPPSEEPFVANVGAHQLRVVDYMPYAYQEEKLEESDDVSLGAALRFQLFNERVNMTKWIQQWRKSRVEKLELGPATIVLGGADYKWGGGNELHFWVEDKSQSMRYRVYSKRKKGVVKSGTVRVGDVVDTGWMNLKMRFIKSYSHAHRKVTFRPLEKPTPVSTSAIKVLFANREEWVALNAPLRFFTSEAGYIITYGNRRLNVGFSIELKKFERLLYQGTMRAASYKSYVNVEGIGEREIYMNEPLKHKGFTFYQASFTQDESGRPIESVLSVNNDPGRWVKYLGSFMIILGSIILFYFKRMKLRLGKR